jgi:hypothetical protein
MRLSAPGLPAAQNAAAVVQIETARKSQKLKAVQLLAARPALNVGTLVGLTPFGPSGISGIFRALRTHSSAVERSLDMGEVVGSIPTGSTIPAWMVGGSIPLATTNPLTDPFPRCGDSLRMLKFLGSTIGIIFLIGLVVVIILLKALF